jgi:hypothetical protein
VVQVIENLTWLSGRLVAREPHPERAGWDVAVVQVEHAAPVAGTADLLSRHEGEELPVLFRRELLADAAPGARLTFRARFTLHGAMAESHPDEGDLRVEAPEP